MFNKNRNVKSQALSMTINLTLSLMCVIIISSMLLCAFSALMCKIDIPLFMSVPLATISVCAATFAAAILFAFLIGEKGLLSGFVLGTIVSATMMILALIKGESPLTSLATLKLIALCCSGAIGGYLGMSVKLKAKRKH